MAPVMVWTRVACLIIAGLFVGYGVGSLIYSLRKGDWWLAGLSVAMIYLWVDVVRSVWQNLVEEW